MSDGPVIQFIPPMDAPVWPIQARTMAEALAMGYRPPRRMTMAEFKAMYETEEPPRD